MRSWLKENASENATPQPCRKKSSSVNLRDALWEMDKNEPARGGWANLNVPPSENSERVFSGRRDISSVRYVAELLLANQPARKRDDEFTVDDKLREATCRHNARELNQSAR